MTESTIGRGVALAATAAVLFGLAAPLIQRGSLGSGPLACGALIYAGAAMVALGLGVRRERSDVPVRWTSWRRIAAVALLGGAAAPALLVLGLKWTDAATGALLLTLEAPFTIVLARLVHREHIGRRALAAAIVIIGASILLAGGHWSEKTGVLGATLIAAAALAWASDNVLSRRLADYDPLSVVMYKGALGGGGAAIAAFSMHEGWPGVADTLLLLGVGGLGFGLSLWLYLRAQRLIGAARTASVFATAPFVGALVAVVLGMAQPSWVLLAATGLIMLGLWLHGGERHDHWHLHHSLTHEHMHTHDDGHHDHSHDPMPSGPHAHVHSHGVTAHAHEHGEDLHHKGHHAPGS